MLQKIRSLPQPSTYADSSSSNGIVADEEDLGQVMDGQHRALPVGQRLSLDAQRGVGEDAAPAFADRHDAAQADPGRVHAQGFLILGPQLHQQIGVALEDGFVERLFDVFGGGEIGGVAHDLLRFRQAAKTCSGESLLRQSRWPSGHSRLKQGLQSRFRLTMSAWSESGGVKPGEEDP